MITIFQRIIHKHGRWIFLILLGFILVAFLAWDYAGMARTGRGVREGSAHVYGKTVNARDLERATRRFRMEFLLTSFQNIPMDERTQALVEDRCLDQMAFMEKAEKMGITVTPEEIIDELKQMIASIRPIFFRDAKSDDEVYGKLLEVFKSRQLNDGDLEIMLREKVVLQKLRTAVQSTVKVSAAEVKAFATEKLEKVTASAFRFESKDFVAQLKPTDEELVRYHQEHVDLFQIPEKTKVRYVVFAAQAAGVSVTDKEAEEFYNEHSQLYRKSDGKPKPFKEVADAVKKKVLEDKAIQQAENKAVEFTVKLVNTSGKAAVSFDELAKQNGLTIKQTDYFSQDEAIKGISSPQQFAFAAFRLDKENLVSDPVISSEGAYVLQYLDRQAASVKPYEQAKADVKNAWIKENSLKLAREKGGAKRSELLQLVKEGKSLDQAVNSLKLTSKVVKNFSAADAPAKDSFENAIRRTAQSLPVGSSSEFIPDAEGGYFVYVTARQAPKPEEITPQVEALRREELSRQQQQMVFQDFAQSVIAEAKISSGRPPESKSSKL